MATFEEKVMSRGNSRTTSDERSSYRIRSVDYISTSGDKNAVQIKPNVSVGGTTGITGLEVSPRFANGKAGNNCIAIKADPSLKGTSGNLTGQVVAVQANIDLGDPTSTRTIADDVAAFESFLDKPSGIVTTGYLVSFLRVRTVNASGWDCFLNLDDAGVGMLGSEQTSGTAVYLKCYVGTKLYTIKMDSAS